MAIFQLQGNQSMCLAGWYGSCKNTIPVVPARGWKLPQGYTIRQTFVIYRTCMRPYVSAARACVHCAKVHCSKCHRLETPHFTLHSSHSTVHTALFALHTSQCTLHTPHFTLTLRTSDSTLHLNSSELFWPHHLFSSHLICHLSSSQLISSRLSTAQPFSSHRSFS